MLKRKILSVALAFAPVILLSACKVAGNEPVMEANVNTYSGIVWIGDSLTQGSLGGNNDNLPNAPYEKLKAYTNLPVEGYGYWGYKTHDIFWVYCDENHDNQRVSPDKLYILWVGSNDWAWNGEINTDTASVIAECEAFLNKGPVSNYLILGTTARIELREQIGGVRACDIINAALKDHFGEHYMDVNEVIGELAYVGDGVHLTQEAYDKVAAAVAQRIR